MFITTFTRARHLSPSFLSTPSSHFSKSRLNIILPSTLASSKWSLYIRSPKPRPCLHLVCPHTCYMSCPCDSSYFVLPNNIWWAVQIIKLLLMYFSPFPCYFVPLRPKCPPQHPILKHPQPVFLPQCVRSSFTPTQNNTQNYSYLYSYLNLYIFGYQSRRQNILHWTIANILWVKYRYETRYFHERSERSHRNCLGKPNRIQ